MSPSYISKKISSLYRLSPCPHLVQLAAPSHCGCHGSRTPECRPGHVRQGKLLLLLLLLLLQACIESCQLWHTQATSELETSFEPSEASIATLAVLPNEEARLLLCIGTDRMAKPKM